MAVKKYNPTSPGRRFQTVSDFEEITTDQPYDPLLKPVRKTGGRNNYGRVTAWQRGRGNKAVSKGGGGARSGSLVRYGTLGVLLAVAIVPASAEPVANLHFERIGTAGGPLPAVITALHQDRDGLIWIGSRNGVTLFDGYTYSTFQHDPSDPRSLSDNTIRTIFEDRDGTLWFGTNTGGLNRFDPAAHSFAHYRHDSADPRST